MVVVLLVVIAAVVVAAVAVQRSRTDAASAADKGRTLTFAVAGDSITAGDSPDIDGGDAGSLSWAFYATGYGLRLTGGWAAPGATTDAMKAGLTRTDPDVLAVLAGSNDVAAGFPFSRTRANLLAMASESGARAVVVSAIPPQDARPASVVRDFNARLRSLAATEHWTFVDAPARVRTSEGRYIDGMTRDGVHPTVRAARIMGGEMRQAIVAAGRAG